MKENSPQICVPVCVRRASELADAIARAAEVADIIELRLDYLTEAELAQGSKEILAALAAKARPMILTLRPAEYGGARPISVEDRLSCRINEPWAPTSREHCSDYLDLDLDLALLLQRRDIAGDERLTIGMSNLA